MSAQAAVRDRTIAGLEDLLEAGASIHEILAALGRRYDSLRRSCVDAGRQDLVAKLKAMKEADSKNLRYALGRQWQA